MPVKYDEVVIGSSLSAVIYAYTRGIPLFFTIPQSPIRFDYFAPEIDFGVIGIPHSKNVMHTLDRRSSIGVSKLIVWERLIFLLSLRGLLPLSNLCINMRDDGEKIVCTNEYSKIYEFNFNTCYYFGDPGTLNIASELISEEKEYTCYDYISFHKGGKHSIDYICTDDDFVSKIWFYSSERIHGNTGVKDACIVSRLTELQLVDPDYSETMARFKMEKIMMDGGMRGPINGYNAQGKPKHYNFRTSHARRTVVPALVPQYKQTVQVRTQHPPEEVLVRVLLEKGIVEYGSLMCEHTSLA